MRKILLCIVLLFNLLPHYSTETFNFMFSGSLWAQDYGAKGRCEIFCECGGIRYSVPCDQYAAAGCPYCPGEVPVSPGFCPFCGQYPCVCELDIDPCDSTSENYNECLCRGIICHPEACDPTSPFFDECECLGINCCGLANSAGDENDCMCLTNLTSTPIGGIIRNNTGNLLYLINSAINGHLGYPSIYNFSYSNSTAWVSDGSPISLIHVDSLTIEGTETDARNYSYNCLGWVLTEGKFIFNTDQTSDINKALGISSVGEAVRTRIIKMSETCEGILPGQVLLLFDETNHYIHAAVYEGKGLYSTKNGLGLGEGVQYWTLQQIQDLYYSPSSGAVKTGYMHTPRRLINSTALGKYSGGLIASEDYLYARYNCECGQ